MTKIHKNLKNLETKIPDAPHAPLGGRTSSVSPPKSIPTYGNYSSASSCHSHHRMHIHTWIPSRVDWSNICTLKHFKG